MKNRIRKNIIVRIILYPFSVLYMLIIIVRNFLFDIGIFKIHRFDIPVISVGNIVAGGTGKTPIIMYLIEKMINDYNSIVVISRGYGRNSSGTIVVSDGEGNIKSADESGDEPVMIARRYKNIPVIVSEKRARAIRLAQDKYNPDIILLDDAFQHRQTHRTVNILLVNAQKDPHNELIIPAGDRREPIHTMKRADIIIYTKTDNAQIDSDPYNLGIYCKNCLYYAQYQPVKLINLHTGDRIAMNHLPDQPVLAFSGIADQNSFKTIFRKYNIQVIEFLPYPDHHQYSKADIDNIIRRMKEKNCQILLTTEKDAVKFDPADFHGKDIYIMEMAVKIKNDKELLQKINQLVDIRI